MATDGITARADWRAELMRYTNDKGVVPTIVTEAGEVRVGFSWARLTRSLSARSVAST